MERKMTHDFLVSRPPQNEVSTWSFWGRRPRSTATSPEKWKVAENILKFLLDHDQGFFVINMWYCWWQSTPAPPGIC